MRKCDKFTISNFICSECGANMPLPRVREREKNHIKTMWCYNCKKETDFTEVRSRDTIKDVDIKTVPNSKFNEELNKLTFDERTT